MRAEIVAVGTELLSFGRSETNSQYLASRLVPLGVDIARKFVVADREEDIRECLALALTRADMVLFSGGLGPTNDDLTREAVAGFLDRPLRESPDLAAALRERYRRFRIPVKANSLRQALVPEGADILPNPHGTAPGLLLWAGSKAVFLLPGPPREFGPMVDNQVIPIIRGRFRLEPAPTRTIKIGGEAESAVDARVGPLYMEYRPRIETTILSSPGVVTLHLVWRGGSDAAEAEATLDELAGKIRRELGVAVYSERDQTLAEAVGERLRRRGLTLAVAESCTGGWIGKQITDVPGSSGYFVGGVICYSNESKRNLLGVSPEVLDREGAVSESAALQMAAGVRRLLGSSIGLGVTGIAGPEGGTEVKPVGTVWIGLSTGSGDRAKRVLLPGDREGIRLRSAHLALDWLRRELE
jgi:nicotinamide-nucleotide amidase